MVALLQSARTHALRRTPIARRWFSRQASTKTADNEFSSFESKFQTVKGVFAGSIAMFGWISYRPKCLQQADGMFPAPALLTWVVGGVTFVLVAPQSSVVSFLLGTGLLGLGSTVVAGGLAMRLVNKEIKVNDDDRATLSGDLQRWSSDKATLKDFQVLEQLLKAEFFCLADLDPATGQYYISRKKLEQVVNSPQTNDGDAAKQDGQEIILRVFSFMDLNNDGRISWMELISGCLLLGVADEADSKVRNELWFRALDLDNNGLISKDELLHWVKVLARLGGIPSQDAIIRRGWFTEPRPATPEEIMDKWMRTYDSSGDGAISPAEFEKMSQSIDFSAIVPAKADFTKWFFPSADARAEVTRVKP